MLPLLVNLTFALLWSIAVFAAIWFGGRRFFTTPRQRAGVAAVGAAAFLFGTALSPRHHFAPPPYQPPAPAAAAAVAPGPAPTPRDVSAACGANKKTGDLPADAAGSIDGALDTLHRTPLDGATFGRKQGVTFAGWAIESDSKGVAAGVCLDVDRAVVPQARVLYGGNRTDVAAVYKSPAVQFSGFEIALPPSVLAPGKHMVRIVVIDGDGRIAALKSERAYTVR